MTVKQFYERLLKDTSVDPDTMQAARDKRDEVGAIVVREVGNRTGRARWVRVGALAQGTQIDPLNDFDGVVEVPELAPEWGGNPLTAMQTVQSWIEPYIDGQFALSSHAIKIDFPDSDFTADIVIGWKRERGLLIPHCPDDEPHTWIVTDPEKHKEQVLDRNKEFGSALFTRQIRILKWLNRKWKMQDALERKPLSSFHITAIALHVLTKAAGHDQLTPYFLERAARLVLTPLPDPAGVGEPIEANDSAYASQLLADAALKTGQALAVSDDEAERILRDVFSDPGRLKRIVKEPTVAVGAGGALGVPVAVAQRRTRPVRAHGDARSHQ